MTTQKPVARLLIATVAAMAVLTGCGASPTAPKTLKRATTATASAKNTTTASTAIAPKAATTPAAKPATTADDTVTTPATSATTTAATSTTDAAPEHTSMAVGAQSTGSTTSIEAIAESALSADTKAALDSSLTAEVTAQKNGVLFGIGTFKCTVTVTNNSDAEQTGMLKVSFMNKDKPSAQDPTLQLVTIPAHGTRDFDFSDSHWSTDNVVAEVSATTPDQSLAAFVLSKKNGVILGMGTFKTTIEVINPENTERSGTLVVQFKNGSKDSATPAIRQAVTLGAHETKTFDFTDKKWSTDNVAVTVE